MRQSRNWCFTVNNYSDEDIANIATWPSRYTIYGKEIGAEGTPHIQGYVMFKNGKTLGGMKQLSGRAHWEEAAGSWEQNVRYCSKEGDVTEHGNKPMSNKRKGEVEKEHWAKAVKLAQTGRMEEIAEENPDLYARLYSTWKTMAKDHMVKPDDEVDVTGEWIYGEPGCGKSRKAREMYPGAYDKMQNKWWDGYQGQDYVIIDDMDCDALGHHLKIWGDRYSFLAETKGGAISIRPKKIIITSNYSPDSEKFNWDREMREAIKRRFKTVHMLTHLGGIKVA